MISQALDYEPGSWISMFISAGLEYDYASVLKDIILNTIPAENKVLFTAVV